MVLLTNAQKEENGKFMNMMPSMIRGPAGPEQHKMKLVHPVRVSEAMAFGILEDNMVDGELEEDVQIRKHFAEVFLWETFEMDDPVENEEDIELVTEEEEVEQVTENVSVAELGDQLNSYESRFVKIEDG